MSCLGSEMSLDKELYVLTDNTYVGLGTVIAEDWTWLTHDQMRLWHQEDEEWCWPTLRMQDTTHGKSCLLCLPWADCFHPDSPLPRPISASGTVPVHSENSVSSSNPARAPRPRLHSLSPRAPARPTPCSMSSYASAACHASSQIA